MKIFLFSSNKRRRFRPACLSFIAVTFVIYILLFIRLNSIGHQEIAGWSSETTRNAPDYILSVTSLLQPTSLCRDPEPIFLLIVVCSSPNNSEARQAIRRTWGDTKNFNYPIVERMHKGIDGSFLEASSSEWRKFVEGNSISSSSFSPIRTRVAFLLGVPDGELQSRIEKEHEAHGDIIQENFADNYNNLTLKTVLMLKWVNENCSSKVKYIVKCDDDTFVNVPNLIHVLLGGAIPIYNATTAIYDDDAGKILSASEDLLMGHNLCRQILCPPDRNADSKYYTSKSMFPGWIFPDFLSGTAYVMSMGSARRLYEECLSTPMFHLEDVYLTGIVAEKINLKRRHHSLFFYLSFDDLCSLRGMLTQHHISPENIVKAYKFITDEGEECAEGSKPWIMQRIGKFF